MRLVLYEFRDGKFKELGSLPVINSACAKAIERALQYADCEVDGVAIFTDGSLLKIIKHELEAVLKSFEPMSVRAEAMYLLDFVARKNREVVGVRLL